MLFLGYCLIHIVYINAAISSVKEQVERIQELDLSVEILIRLLCAVPGWSEKNVQVRLLMPVLGLLFQTSVPPDLIRIAITRFVIVFIARLRV